MKSLFELLPKDTGIDEQILRLLTMIVKGVEKYPKGNDFAIDICLAEQLFAILQAVRIPYQKVTRDCGQEVFSVASTFATLESYESKR